MLSFKICCQSKNTFFINIKTNSTRLSLNDRVCVHQRTTINAAIEPLLYVHMHYRVVNNSNCGTECVIETKQNKMTFNVFLLHYVLFMVSDSSLVFYTIHVVIPYNSIRSYSGWNPFDRLIALFNCFKIVIFCLYIFALL